MNLINQKQLAELAGVSSGALTKARNNDRLKHYNGTKKYDTDDPLNRSFLETIPKERLMNKAAVIPVNESQHNEHPEDLTRAITSVQKAQKKKLVEEAELKKQQRIKTELQNATRRGELLEASAIEESVMMFLDKWLNTGKRIFSAMFDEIQRTLLASGEKSPDLKRTFLNQMETAADEAKTETVERLNDIKIEQGKAK